MVTNSFSGDRTRLNDNSTPLLDKDTRNFQTSALKRSMPKIKAAAGQIASAIILAGGKSSRMGRDKASLILDGEFLLERLIRVTSPLVSDIVIMLYQGQNLPCAFNSVDTNIILGRDSVSHQGPLQGISDAADLLPQYSELVFVLACDLPFLTTGWLEKMLSALIESPEIDIVVSKQGQFLNPLIAVYRKHVFMKVESYLEIDKRSCLVLLDENPHKSLEPPSGFPTILSNINTPDDYEAALQELRSNPTSPPV